MTPGSRSRVADVNRLSGAEKVAIVMLALDPHHAPLWSRLDDGEIRDISQAMATLGMVDSKVVEKLLDNLVQGAGGPSSIMGSFEKTQKLLASILPDDKVESMMEELRGPAGRTMWDKLGHVDESVLANYLKNEYPQTAAVVLSKLKPENAARVLAALPQDFALECVTRMLRMEPVQREILERIEETLRTEFMSNLARKSKRDSHEMIAEIFNALDRSSEGRLMALMEVRDPVAAERVRSLMFVFEDLATLDPGAMQTLLRNVEKDQLVMGVKGASDELREIFFTNMSERAAKILRDDMASLGPVRLADVDQAQMGIVKTAKDLANKGEIILADSKGEDQLIY